MKDGTQRRRRRSPMFPSPTLRGKEKKEPKQNAEKSIPWIQRDLKTPFYLGKKRLPEGVSKLIEKKGYEFVSLKVLFSFCAWKPRLLLLIIGCAKGQFSWMPRSLFRNWFRFQTNVKESVSRWSGIPWNFGTQNSREGERKSLRIHVSSQSGSCNKSFWQPEWNRL